MRKNDSLTLSLAILRKSASLMHGLQDIGGVVGAATNPWLNRKSISPIRNNMQGINPEWAHDQSIWGGGESSSAPKLPAPQPMPSAPSVAPHLPSPPNFGMQGSGGGLGGSGGGAPSFLPKSSAMMQPPKFPATIKAPGMMHGPSAPASAGSVFKPVGAQHRAVPGMSSRLGMGSKWFMGGGGGSANGGNPVPTAPSVGALAAGSSSPGAGLSSPGTTGGGNSGSAGQA